MTKKLPPHVSFENNRYRVRYKKSNKYTGKSTWVCPTCGEHSEIIPRYVSCSFPLLQHIFKGLHIGVEYFEDEN